MEARGGSGIVEEKKTEKELRRVEHEGVLNI
jgi:hypothetical protein